MAALGAWCLSSKRAQVDTASRRSLLLPGKAGTAQLALTAGLLDEMEMNQMPVPLGQGRRLFEQLAPDHIELELARIVEAPDVTHLRYRVRR